MDPEKNFIYEGYLVGDEGIALDGEADCIFNVSPRSDRLYFMTNVRKYHITKDGSRGEQKGRLIRVALFGELGTEFKINYVYRSSKVGCKMTLSNLQSKVFASSWRMPAYTGQKLECSNSIHSYDDCTQSGKEQQHLAALRIGQYHPTILTRQGPRDPYANIHINAYPVESYYWKGEKYPPESPASLSLGSTNKASTQGNTGHVEPGSKRDFKYNFVQKVRLGGSTGHKLFKIIAISETEHKLVKRFEIED